MPIETLDQLEAALEKLVSDFPRIVQTQTEVAANDSIALVDRRLVETGLDENGAPFLDYTSEYKAKKQKIGRYSGKVDFQLTGQMLASTGTGLKNIGITSSSVNGSVATVVSEGRDQETRGKIEGNNNKRPGFLSPSKEEVGRVERIREKRIEQMIVEDYLS